MVFSKSQLVVCINAAFWLDKLLLGYMLQPASSEERRILGGKKGFTSSFNQLKVVLYRYFWATVGFY